MSITTDTRPLSLAARIKVARVGAGFDQVDLAELLGVSRGTISNWEWGKTQPQLGQAVSLAQATGVTLEWLAAGVHINENTPAIADEGGSFVHPPGFEPGTH